MDCIRNERFDAESEREITEAIVNALKRPPSGNTQAFRH